MKKYVNIFLSGAFVLAAAACGDATPPAPPANTPPPSKAEQGLKMLTQGTDNATGGGTAPAAAGGETAAAAAAAAQPADTAAAVPSEEVSEIAYAYSPIGKRDPFRSLFDQLRREEQNQQLTELQTFEVDQLKLVAIVSRIATPYAMVEDPNGKGHTLSRGTLIGKNWGRVSEINPDCVVIKEEYRDYTGRKVTNKISICLPKPEDLKLD
jgi:type IV pilus assembly protein PilP